MALALMAVLANVPGPSGRSGVNRTPRPGRAVTDPGRGVFSVRPMTGALHFPDNAVASYQFHAAGDGRAVTAQWSGAPELSLHLACPGRTRSLTGASPLRVDEPPVPGVCLVTLAEPSAYGAQIPYTVDVAAAR